MKTSKWLLLNVLGGGRQIAVADRYVNTVTGSDSNNGLTFTTAKATLGAAKASLTASVGGSIAVYSTQEAPAILNGDAPNDRFTDGAWVIVPALVGSRWYAEGPTYKYTSGWTAAGGGVYYRVAQSTRAYAIVPTLTDANGNTVTLKSNDVTPTTPAAGEIGLSGGNVYVHLPGDANANANTILHCYGKYPVYLEPAYGDGSSIEVAITGMNLRYAFGKVCHCGAGNSDSTLSLTDCLLEYASGEIVGGRSSGAGKSYINATRVTCRCARTNDGFNFHQGGTANLVDCISEYNLDEGYSPHETYVLNATNCVARYNGTGGFTAVMNAEMNLTGCLAHNNGTLNKSFLGDRGGFNYCFGTPTGVLINCEARDNWGEGFYCDGGTVTITNLTSGTANGNTEADVAC